MGHIKELDGVDFVINSRPLTKDEEAAISNYIRAYKAKRPSKKNSGQTENYGKLTIKEKMEKESFYI